jgi:hypothetical protein
MEGEGLGDGEIEGEDVRAVWKKECDAGVSGRAVGSSEDIDPSTPWTGCCERESSLLSLTRLSGSGTIGGEGLSRESRQGGGNWGEEYFLLIKKCSSKSACSKMIMWFLGPRIVELPSLVSLRIPNEDALLHVWSKTPKRPLVLLNENISGAASNAKHRQIRLGPKKRLMRSWVRQSYSDDPVVNMNECWKGLSP